MSELENLSNDELRIELLKYGFANMPVTSTTRKILLKKLKNAKETQKTKNRRETVAVMKASDDEEPEEIARGKKEKTPNRRATMAVLEKTKKVPATTTTKNGSETPPKKDKSRRSSRATPAKDNSKPIVSSTAALLQEQSDDDVIEIIEPISTRRSKSKTPTLAKSETVRTSVSHYTRTVPIVREEDQSTEEEDRSFEVEFQEPPPVTRRTTTLSYSTNKPQASKSTGKTLSTSFNPTISYKKLESDENDDDDDIETPYLSNFAQRLSTLRAEPLSESMKRKEITYSQQPSTSHTSSSSSSNYRYSSSQYSMPPQNRKSVGGALAKEYKKLDKKYNINKYVVICMIIMAIVAIYVIFFT